MSTILAEFTVPGQPVGKGRPRVSSRGGKFATMYTPAKTANYESLVALFASQAMAGRPPITGPVNVSLSIHLQIPESWSAKKKAAAPDVPPTKKPDLDNIIKAVCDGMNGVVWVDDVQVVQLWADKIYSHQPGVVVRVVDVS